MPIADETEITQSHQPVEPPPPPAGPPPGPPAAPPPAGPPPGLVMRDVAPWLALLGILAVAGLLVWLFVLRDQSTKGPTVPAVVGMQQQQAIAKLTGDGFNVKVIVGPAARPRGIVVSQIPGGGSRLDKGQTVTLHVSNGHRLQVVTTPTKPTPTTSTQIGTTTSAGSSKAQLPDVTGQDAASGAGQVEAAGFVAETDPVTTSGTPGSIVQETPSGGSQAPVGSVVQLGVYVGATRPARKVPNVVGQNASGARAALLNAKLTVKTVDKKGTAKSRGVVVAQTPAPGGSVPEWTQVTITVGS